MKEDNFWTDELVKEFVIAYNKIDKLVSGVDPIGQTIKEWKQSKQSAPEPSALPKSDTVVEDEIDLGFTIAGHWKREYDKLKSEVDAIRKETAIRVCNFILEESILPRDTHWFDAGKSITSNDIYSMYLSTLNLNSNDTGKEETGGLKTGIMSQMDMYNMGYKDGVKYAQFTKPEQPTNDNAFVDEHFWEQELHKCKINPYYYATKYLTVNGKPFTTRLTETEFNDEFNRGIGNAQSAPEPSALPNKEYEILSFKNESGLWKCLADNVYGRCNGDGKYLTTNELLNQSEIHSVRRLS